jgi:hypothetical protein
MSPRTTEYNNTIIYKIYCKDVSVTDLYIGHTTDFVKRKQAHRYACEDTKSQIKLYKFIREHGGWKNWDMDIIAFDKCRDLDHARQKEQEYFLSLGATLNSIEPFPVTIDKADLKNSIQYITGPPSTHIEITSNFKCESCMYTCYKKSDMNKHILTRKHRNRINEIENININKVANTKYICSKCNKEYAVRNSLWYHQRKCKSQNEITEINTPVINTNNTLIFRLLTQNKELIELLLTHNKEIQNSQNINSNVEDLTQYEMPVSNL